MGLDINIAANNHSELSFAGDYYNKHSLSRTFCNLMCRKDVITHEPELDQIGKITSVDITPIYKMESYPDEEGLSFFLETADSEEERKEILTKAEEDKAGLQGNIDNVLGVITVLIERLNSIDNLSSLLLPTNFDTLNNKEYFSDFQKDVGRGYIGNNFGQDLRNFKRFLEFAKEHGTKTVWFHYG